MQATAHARFVRMAPRKTRLLVALVRGRSVVEARRQLLFSQKNAAEPVLKVLNSAVANATNNLKMDPASLVVVKAWVDEGPTTHRYTPKAQGRATPIRHRSSHIHIVVEEKVKSEKGKVATGPIPLSGTRWDGTEVKKATVKKTSRKAKNA